MGAAVLAAVLPAGAAASTVYLNFAGGDEALQPGETDDAAANRSSPCEARRLGRWEGGTGCGDRASCRAQVVRHLQALWRPYAVDFTIMRPATGPYTMALIGPPSGSCGFGVAGAAPIDCFDAGRADVAFAFDCAGAPVACARLVSHELGHAFGLEHSDRACDPMAADAPVCERAEFHDEEVPLRASICGRQSQNTHLHLLAVLGPRDDGPAGCAVGRGRGGGLLVLLAAISGRGLARRRLRPRRSRAAAPSRPPPAPAPS